MVALEEGEDVEKAREEVNKQVEEMNRKIPEYSRVLPKNVILLPGEALPASHKGSLIRSEITKKYQVTIFLWPIIKNQGIDR